MNNNYIIILKDLILDNENINNYIIQLYLNQQYLIQDKLNNGIFLYQDNYLYINKLNFLKYIDQQFGYFIGTINIFVEPSFNNFKVKQISTSNTEIRISKNIDTDINELLELNNYITNNPYYNLCINNGPNQIYNIQDIYYDNINNNINYRFTYILKLDKQFDTNNNIVKSIIAKYNIKQLEIEPINIIYISKDDIIQDLGTPNIIMDNYQDIISNIMGNSIQNIDLNINYQNFEQFVHFGNIYKKMEIFFNKIIKYINSRSTIEKDIIYNNMDYFQKYYFNLYPRINDIILNYDDNKVILWKNKLYQKCIDYDKNNIHKLSKILPKYITQNKLNTNYVSFVQMIGNYFDIIWVYIKNIKNIYKLDNDSSKTVSKHFIYNIMKSYGFDIFFDNYSNYQQMYLTNKVIINNIIPNPINPYNPSTSYHNGDIVSYLDNIYISLYDGNNTVSIQDGLQFLWKQVFKNQFNDYYYISKSIQDIDFQIQNRLLNSMFYIYKTKGTQQCINTILNCFGLDNKLFYNQPKIKKYLNLKLDGYIKINNKNNKEFKQIIIKFIGNKVIIPQLNLQIKLFIDNIKINFNSIDYTCVPEEGNKIFNILDKSTTIILQGEGSIYDKLYICNDIIDIYSYSIHQSEINIPIFSGNSMKIYSNNILQLTINSDTTNLITSKNYHIYNNYVEYSNAKYDYNLSIIHNYNDFNLQNDDIFSFYKCNLIVDQKNTYNKQKYNYTISTIKQNNNQNFKSISDYIMCRDYNSNINIKNYNYNKQTSTYFNISPVLNIQDELKFNKNIPNNKMFRLIKQFTPKGESASLGIHIENNIINRNKLIKYNIQNQIHTYIIDTDKHISLDSYTNILQNNDININNSLYTQYKYNNSIDIIIPKLDQLYNLENVKTEINKNYNIDSEYVYIEERDDKFNLKQNTIHNCFINGNSNYIFGQGQTNSKFGSILTSNNNINKIPVLQQYIVQTNSIYINDKEGKSKIKINK